MGTITFKTRIETEQSGSVRIALGLLGYMETGRWSRNYANVTYHPKDGGGLTVGWCQLALTTQTKLLNLAIDTYIANPSAKYREDLRRWDPLLSSWDRGAQGNADLHALFRKMAYDPVWRDIQDKTALDEYDKAVIMYDELDFSEDLSAAILFDAQIHGGVQYIVKCTKDALAGRGKFVSALSSYDGTKLYEGEDQGGERGFMQAFNVVRRAWLLGSSNDYTSSTVYRQSMYLWLIEQGTWDLHWGIDVKVYAPTHRVGEVDTLTEELLLPSLPI